MTAKVQSDFLHYNQFVQQHIMSYLLMYVGRRS